MRQPAPRPISGHVFKRKGKRGVVWYAKYRLPDGSQQKKRLGPAWTEKTAPPDGYFTKGKAQTHLDELLRQARDGSLPGMVKTGKTFTDAADEWLAYCENVRDCKPSTMRDYRNMVRVLVREFGKRRIETITSEDIDLWISGYGGSNRTRQKYLVCLGSIFKRAMKVYGLPRNPADLVERPRVRRAAKIDVLRPEEVLALVRAAESEQDAAIFHTAAFAGLRMGELLALRWRDVDFTRARSTSARTGLRVRRRRRRVGRSEPCQWPRRSLNGWRDSASATTSPPTTISSSVRRAASTSATSP